MDFVRISFKSYYDLSNDLFYVFHNDYSGKIDKNYLIEDSYFISFQKVDSSNDFLSYEKERISAYSEENEINTTELHVNPWGDLCLAPKNTSFYKKNSINKNLFIERLLIPFLYSHSFLEKNGVRPWKDYGHNEIGYFEAYKREKIPSSKEKAENTLFQLKESLPSLEILTDQNYIENLRKKSEEAYAGLQDFLDDLNKFSINISSNNE